MSDTVRHSRFARAALQRLVTAMQAKLPEAIEAEALASGLRLQQPLPTQYYLPGTYWESVLLAEPICVVVEQYAPTTREGYASGTPSTGKVVGVLPVRVRLFWREDAYEPAVTELHPRPLTQGEHYALGSEAYKAALIEVLAAYAQEPGVIDDIRLVSDLASPTTISGMLRGVAATEWELRTETLLPTPSRFESAQRAV